VAIVVGGSPGRYRGRDVAPRIRGGSELAFRVMLCAAKFCIARAWTLWAALGSSDG